MKKINVFEIDTSTLNAKAQSRILTIMGDNGSVFSLSVTNEDSNYYDFTTNTFTAGEKRLEQAILGENGRYEVEIFFPTITDDDQYDFRLWAEPYFETEIDSLLSTNKILYETSLTQKADVNVIFSLASSDHSGCYQTLPSNITRTNTPSINYTDTFELSWVVKTVDSDACNGFKVLRQPVDTDFEISFTDATCDYNNDPTITMDSTSAVRVGMSVSGTGIPAAATVSSITNATTFELSASTTGGSVTNGTLTFTSKGTEGIMNSKDSLVRWEDDLKLTEPKKFSLIVNGDASSADLTFNSVRGLNTGSSILAYGPNFKNEAENYVVSLDVASKTATVSTSQTTPDDTVLFFTGCGTEMTITSTVTISRFPLENYTITLNLDNILDI